MKKYEIKIKGTTHLIWNRMKKEIEDEKKKLMKNELAEYEEKNWIKKAEINNGNAIIPTTWLKSMLINACKQTGMIPHYATKKNERYTRYIQSVLVLPNPPIIVCKKNKLKQLGGFYPGQPGKLNSGKIWKIFPMIDEWSATFYIADPFGRMKTEELKILLEHGGDFIGIGDQRPMNYGRFIVESIKEV
jgi:hypothetical protein